MMLTRKARMLGILATAAFCGLASAGSAAIAADKPAPAATAEPKFSAADLEFFEKQVRPVLVENCFKCHDDKKQKGNLRLDARSFVIKGGDHGPAVHPTEPDKSTMLRAIGYTDEDMQMPPSGKMDQAKIDVLTKWTKAGAPWPAGESVAAGPAHEEGESRDPDQNRGRWEYTLPKRPAVPAVKDAAWVKTPIDAFVLQKLEAKNLKPSERADRVALVRRAYFDLIGLPPTPQQVDAFVNDQSPDAWPKLIDQLLANPHYGERWGRHWLDLVRYAETNGYERDGAKPQAWRYRDYVINSFNNDKPYDQFLKEQLAGDELDTVTPETMIATGFYRLGVWDDEPADRPLARYDVLDGIVSTTSSVVLGMSVGCARCHDHKKDPILAKDYYSMLAFFQDVSDMNGKNLRRIADPATKAESDARIAARQQEETSLYRQVYALEQAFVAAAPAKGIDIGEIAGNDLADLTYKFYRDTFDTLPDFTSLKFEDSGSVADGRISLSPATRAEAIGLVFEGKLKVPNDGDYVFHLRSSEGVRLFIDGKQIINRPGKGRHVADFPAKLKAGLLPIKLEYFNGYTTPELTMAWSGPGFERRLLSRTGNAEATAKPLLPDSREQGQTWVFNVTSEQKGWNQPGFDASEWPKVVGGFGRKGTPGAVVRTDWSTPQIYLRKEFDLDRVPAAVALSLHHDEDVAVYLNGVLAYQSNGHLRKYQTVSISKESQAALKKGKNLIAVSCKQTTGGQYVDAGLVELTPATILAQLIADKGPIVFGDKKTLEYIRASQSLETLRKTPLEPAGIEVMAVSESTRNRPSYILIRGNPGSEGDPVKPGFPTVLVPKGQETPELPKASPDGTSSGKRRVLAEWLASDKNPLTARVMANRIWQYHFGRGLNPSPNEFGRLGEGVTHPELLDWLGSEFSSGGWTLKRMHKLIMTSNTYQMSARANPQGMAADPANNLFWRFNMRRLGAEEVRDSMLAVTGSLNLEMSGPSVYPPIPKEVLAGQSRPGEGWKKNPTREEATRRSVYVFVKRSLLVPILNIHDQADTDGSCPVRFTTTVPTQALGMLNGEFSNEQAAELAKRIAKESPDGLESQVKQAIRLTTGRESTPDEVQRDLAFIAKLKSEDKLSDSDALRIYCLMALNTNEFVYLD